MMIRVFCDFDATITIEDVGERFFRNFGGKQAENIVDLLLTEEINARESLTLLCEAVGSVTPDIFERYVDQFEIDPDFPEFVRFCQEQTIPLVIVSDGLDFYIEKILSRHGLAHLPFFSNHLEFMQEGSRTKLVPQFHYRDSECDLCGNCKRNHLLMRSGDDDIIVYIGDGFSDRCPVKYADIVFAKKELIKHCQTENITYHEFSKFADVRSRLEVILQRKRIKKRRQAEMARREVFHQG